MNEETISQNAKATSESIYHICIEMCCTYYYYDDDILCILMCL